MSRKCSIPGCKSNGDEEQTPAGTLFHYIRRSLRKDPMKFERWQAALQCTQEEMNRLDCVCSLHFCDDDYELSDMMKIKLTAGLFRSPRLKSDAVPHLKLKNRGKKKKLATEKKEEEECSSTNFEQIFMPNMQIKMELEDLCPDDMLPESSHFESTLLQVKMEPEDFFAEHSEEMVSVAGPSSSFAGDPSSLLPQHAIKSEKETECEDLVPENSLLVSLPSEPTVTEVIAPESYSVEQISEEFCKLCKQIFKSTQDYKNHFVLEDICECKYCDTKYSNMSRLQSLYNHVIRVHGKLPFCVRCKEFFRNKYFLKQHEAKCNTCRTRKNYHCDKSEELTKCSLCWRTFRSKAELSTHMIKDKHMHVDTIEKKYTGHLFFYRRLKLKNKFYNTCMFMVFCPHCKKDFFYNQYFRFHFFTCYKNCKDFICPFCNVPKSCIPENIEKHIYDHLEMNCKVFTCEKCKFTFYTETNYKLHMAAPLEKHLPVKEKIFIRRNRKRYQLENKIVNKKLLTPFEFLALPESVNNKAEPVAILPKPVNIEAKPIAILPKPVNIEEESEKFMFPEFINIEEKPEIILPKSVNIEPEIIRPKKLLPTVTAVPSFSQEKSKNRGKKSSKLKTTVKSEESILDDGYICKKCNGMVLKKKYVDHINCHVYKCPFCTRVVTTPDRMRQHMGLVDVNSMKQFEFLITEENRYSDDGERDLHILVQYPHKLVYITEPPLAFEANPLNFCQVCSKQFQFHCQFLLHKYKENH